MREFLGGIEEMIHEFPDAKQLIELLCESADP
jgi:hypothetical protein